MPKFKKGSAAAKAFMAKLRDARGTSKVGKPKAKAKRKGLFVKKLAVYARPNKAGKVKPYVRKVGSMSNYDKAPAAVKKIIDNLDDGGNYSELAAAKKALNNLGYDMDFDLNGQITKLKKKGSSKKVGAVKAPVYKYAAVKKRVDDLYKKSGMINTNEKWENKIIEMLQDNSIEAYTIYQTLNADQKKDVLNELFTIDNDMGSYGDGKLQTSKENLAILLQDAKNGMKYNNSNMNKVGTTKMNMSNNRPDFMDIMFKSKIDMNLILDEIMRIENSIKTLKALDHGLLRSASAKMKRKIKLLQLQMKTLKSYLNSRAKIV